MRRFFRDFLDTFVPRVKKLFDPHGALHIVHEADDKLILKNNIRQFVFNKRYRTVLSGTRLVAPFDAIKVIKVDRIGVDNGPDYWAVTLRVKGALLSVNVGDASDEANAAIIASRISTMTGKEIRWS